MATLRPLGWRGCYCLLRQPLPYSLVLYAPGSIYDELHEVDGVIRSSDMACPLPTLTW